MLRTRMGAVLLLLGAGTMRAEDAAPPFRIRVTTFEGAPIVGARLEVRRAVGRRSSWEWQTLAEQWELTPAGADDTVIANAATGAGGWAQLDPLPDGAFDVTARVAGRAVRGAQVLSPPARGRSSLTILLDAGHIVEGRMVTEDGTPLAGVLVAATFPSAGTARWDDDERSVLARTDEEGAFRLEGIPAGTAVLRACPAGTWCDRERAVDVPRAAPLEIVVRDRLLECVVTDRRTGIAVANALVHVAWGPPGAPTLLGCATTDEHGRFSLRSPDQTLSSAEIRAKGYLRELLLPQGARRPAHQALEIEAVPSVRLRGCVLDSTGSSVVTATWLSGFALSSASTRTAADGTFELGVCEGLVHVVATRPGRWGSAVPDLDVLLATGKDGAGELFHVAAAGRDNLQLGVPPLPDAGSIRGRIVTEEGVPVSTRLHALAKERWRRGDPLHDTETASDGSFLFENVPAGQTDLLMSTPRWAGMTVAVEPGATTSGIEVVVPSELVSVSGRIVGLDGRARVYVADGNTSRRHAVGADGSFMFRATVLDGFVEAVAVTTDDWTGHERRRAEGGASVALGDITLRAPTIRSFRVVAAADGAPVPGAAAALVPLVFPYNASVLAEQAEDLPWRADGEGRLRIVIPDDGVWGIQVRSAGFTGVNLRGRLTGGDLALKPLAVAAGRVRYGAGGPAIGVRVRVRSSDSTAPRDEAEAITDAEGRFRIAGLMTFPHDVVVESTPDGPSVSRALLSKVALPSESLDLVVGAVRTIEGRVIDVLGRPVAGAPLRAKQARGAARGSVLETSTGADGRFRLAGALAGKYDLHVKDEESWVGTSPTDVAAGTVDAVLRADIGLRIVGRVVDADGKPEAGWLVTARRRWDEPRRCARSDGNGRFLIEDLGGGAWNLTVGQDGGEPVTGGEGIRAGTEDVVLVLR